jgi:hypothetical protein
MRLALALLTAPLLALLWGCAHAPAEPADVGRKLPAITAYAANPFVPVNLYLNANQHLDAEHAALLEYAAKRLADSQAFVRVDRGVQRWPITLQAVHTLQPAESTWRTRLHLAPAVRKHSLVVEIFEEPDSVAVIELGAETAGSGQAAVDALLERLMAEIATRKLVPRWNAFKPEKKKPTVPGRAT